MAYIELVKGYLGRIFTERHTEVFRIADLKLDTCVVQQSRICVLNSSTKTNVTDGVRMEICHYHLTRCMEDLAHR